MIEDLKLLLGEAAKNYTDLQLSFFIKMATAEVEGYCNCKLDKELELIVTQIAAIKINRQNSEGLSAQSYSGVSESYVDGYPAEIQNVLNRKRKIKTI